MCYRNGGWTDHQVFARSLGVGSPSTASCEELFNSAVAAGGAAWDHSWMMRVLERLACHELRERNTGG